MTNTHTPPTFRDPITGALTDVDPYGDADTYVVSNFLPILSVEDGKVTIDFGDSFDNSYEGDALDPINPVQEHVDLIDSIIGVGTTQVERLRRLADFIERQDQAQTDEPTLFDSP